ncbi:MAG: glycosyltransferase [Gammaproteobacteria bacterium]
MSRVAVLIPVWNAQRDVERTLLSIDRQPEAFDLVVVDDGSEPVLRIDPSAWRHSIHLIRLAQHRGAAAARNAGLRYIFERSYEYVALQDAGDSDIDGRLSKQIVFLDAHPEIGVVGSWAQYVDTAGEPLYVHKPPADTRGIRKRMCYVLAFPNPACMFRAAALKTIGLYDESFPIASDYELLFRLTRRYPSANMQEILILKEDNPLGLSLSKRKLSLLYRLKTQVRYFAWTSLHAYLGIGSTLVLLVLPYRLVGAIKTWRKFAK